MEKKQRFFIYDRKEVGVLMLLGVMVAVFAFTLGVHLGKRVTGGKSGAPHAGPTEGVSPVAEAPSHAETEQAMTQPTAVPPAMTATSEDAVNQATHDEVSRTGIKLEDSKQLELPEKTKSKNAGATSVKAVPTPHETQPSHAAAPVQAEEGEGEGEVPATHSQATSKNKNHSAKHATKHPTGHPAASATEHAAEAETPQEKQQQEALAELHALNEKAKHATSGKASGPYTLQIGSYSNVKEAQDRVKDLEISGLSPRIHATDIKSKGRWYRIYLGGFATKSAAEKAGEKYRSQGMIDSFIVAKSVE